MSASTMSEPKRHLDRALFSGIRRGILGMMFTYPGQSLGYRELVRAMGSGQGAVQRELRNLTEAGILLRLSEGRRVRYCANPDCPIYAELHRLFHKLASNP